MEQKRIYSDKTSIATRKRTFFNLICIALSATVFFAVSFSVYHILYAPPAFEENIQLGTPSPSADLAYDRITVKDGYVVGICGKVLLKDGEAQLYLTNFENNNVWFSITMIDNNNNVIAETGILRQGEYLESVPVNLYLEPNETATVTIQIIGYKPDTYVSAGSFEISTELVGV